MCPLAYRLCTPTEAAYHCSTSKDESGSGTSTSPNKSCSLASCSALAEEEAAWQRRPRYSTFTCVKDTTSWLK